MKILLYLDQRFSIFFSLLHLYYSAKKSLAKIKKIETFYSVCRGVRILECLLTTFKQNRYLFESAVAVTIIGSSLSQTSISKFYQVKPVQICDTLCDLKTRQNNSMVN